MTEALEKRSPANERPEGEVLRADRTLRNRLLLFLVVFSAAGAAIVFFLERHLETIVASSEDNPEAAVRQVFQLLRVSTAVGGIGLIVFGTYFARFSLRVLSSGSFPPPGTKVVRDTQIQRGSAARVRGWSGVALAALLVILGLAVPWVPDLVIRPMIYRAAEDAEGEAVRPGDGKRRVPDNPELHAALQLPLPGCSETGPGPRASSLSSTPS